RGQKADYDNWADQGPEYKIWDYDHCLKAFKATENNSHENPDEEFKKYHGFNGLLHVQDCCVHPSDILKDFIKTTRSLGVPYNNDFNGQTKWDSKISDGKRFSLADGYLKDVLKKVQIYPPIESGEGISKIVAVNVKSFAHMLNIIWDEEKKDENLAIGVKYFCNGGVHNSFIAPKGEVILCGGSINSAQILMLSGIGPKNNLEANNIKVRKELPVGRNLQDHPFCFISGKVSIQNSTDDVLQSHAWCCGIRPGMFFKANAEGKALSQKDFLDERPDIQTYICTQNVLDTKPVPKLEVIILASVLNLPSSVGHLELSSSNPFDQPKIFLNFYEKPDDMYRMISSFKFLCEIIKQPLFSKVWGIKEIGSYDEFGKWCSFKDEMSDEDWEQHIREKTISSFHSCGTVKMTPESQRGCVNHRLQVYGTKNLRVVDASIFPIIPNGNTNAPVAMVAWKASRIIEEDYRKKI
ncbi:17879_t:CDS:2, partial [Funneliformis geosporum]